MFGLGKATEATDGDEPSHGEGLNVDTADSYQKISRKDNVSFQKIIDLWLQKMNRRLESLDGPSASVIEYTLDQFLQLVGILIEGNNCFRRRSVF